MSSNLEALREENRLLRLRQQQAKERIRLYKFLNWIQTDKKIKEIKKKLYGTKQR